MRPLSELVNTEDPGISLIREWVRGAVNQCELLPPSDQRDQVLLQTQVTTRSPMGAIATIPVGFSSTEDGFAFWAPAIRA